MINEPLVSVVIPFYIGLGWLKEALDSVVSQTYKNIEIFVINDGSEEDLSNLKEIYKNKVNFIDQINTGPAGARNKGIDLSSGKYIAFLDSDDVWFEEKLTRQIAYMEANNLVWSQHSYEMFWDGSDKKKIIDTSIYFGDVYKDCYISFKIQISCVVVLKKILIDNGIWFPVEKRYGQDGEFYRKIAEKYEIGYIKGGVLSKFRIRGSNAGFQAKIQLEDKASTWDKIKYNDKIISIFPRSIIIAYKLSNLFSRVIKFIQVNISNNKNILETISKALYVFPYLIFKIHSRKLSKR